MPSKSTKTGGDAGSNVGKSENVSTTDQNGLISPEAWDSLFGDSASESAAADTRDKIDKITVRRVTKIKHGFECFGEDDGELKRNSQWVIPVKGYYDVAMHGAPDAVAFGGKEANMSPKMLARIIRSQPNYTPGENIRLLSCYTGASINGDYCFAEELSNALGVKVMAPTDKLYISSGNRLAVGRWNMGQFRIFTPNERRRRR